LKIKAKDGNMSNSLIDCIIDSQESLFQNVYRLSSRKDLVSRIDEKLFEIIITNFFAKGELENEVLATFLRLLEMVSSQKPFYFNKHRLTLVNLIF
jgi:hypothetical protein